MVLIIAILATAFCVGLYLTGVLMYTLFKNKRAKRKELTLEWEEEKRHFENVVSQDIICRRTQHAKELMDDKSKTRRRQAIIKRNRRKDKS